MITKYKLFLETYEEPKKRSMSISIKDAVDIIKNNCTEFLKDKKSRIFRGLGDNDSSYLLVKPSEGLLRRSANTDNHYTLLIDHSKRWDGFPKRSKSIICTTNGETACNYGFLYVVIPFDNAKIGVCPLSDIWYSFKMDINEFVQDLSRVGVSDYDFDAMLAGLESLGKRIIESKGKIDYDKSSGGLSSDWLFSKLTDHPDLLSISKSYYKEWESNNSLSFYDFLDNLFDPKRNKFKVESYEGIIKMGDFDQEVWTDSNCVMVLAKDFNSLLKELN